MSGTEPGQIPIPTANGADPVLEYAPAAPRAGLFRSESVARSFSVYLPAMAIYRGLGLVRGLVLTWLMTQYEFGLLQVALLAINVLMPLCALGTYEGVARYVPMYETRGTLRAYIRRIMPVIVLLAVVLAGALCLAARPFGHLLFATGSAEQTDSQLLLTLVMAGTILALVLYFVLLAVLRGLRMFRAVSLMELLSNVAFTGVAIAAAALGARSAAVIVLCYLATTAAVIPLFAFPLGRAIRELSPLPAVPTGDLPSRPLSQLLKFSAWAAIAAITWQLLQYYPLWYLQKVSGPQVTAVFGGVRQMAQVVLVATIAVTTVVMTAVTKTWEAQGRAEADRKLALAFKSAGLFLLAACAVISAFAPLIIRLLPPSYAPGARIIPLSLLFFLICSHLSFLGIHFSLIEKPRHMVWPWVVGVAFNILFGVLLIRPGLGELAGLRAAAVSGVLAGAGALLTCLLLLRWEGRPLDRGAYLILAASFALALPTPLVLIAAVAILVAAWTTGLIFTPEEKLARRAYLTAARSRVARSG